ncbi:3',5'-cyclic-nucleotide phosphodiesterase [Cronobacter malonaticus 507]|nr:3',5'-cyclic-nucleotide phosphodiesterase [Cronobacter malonaticus 507]
MLAGIPAYICGSVCPANPLWLGGAHVPEVCDPPALMVHRLENGMLASHFIAAYRYDVANRGITAPK